MEIPKYENHPLANCFRMLTEDELNELADDIADQGVLDPVILYEGMILDGRNRFKAWSMVCAEIIEGQSPGPAPEIVFRHFERCPDLGTDPVAFVLSRNEKRRHDTPTQRAQSTTKVLALSGELDRMKKEAKERIKEGGSRGGSKSSKKEKVQAPTEFSGGLQGRPKQQPPVSNGQPPSEPAPKSTKKKKDRTVALEVAEVAGVSEDTARKAIKVEEEGVPEVADAVIKGEVSMAEAQEIIKEPKEKQAEKIEEVKESGLRPIKYSHGGNLEMFYAGECKSYEDLVWELIKYTENRKQKVPGGRIITTQDYVTFKQRAEEIREAETPDEGDNHGER